MSKPGLGKGLGQLMGGDSVAGHGRGSNDSPTLPSASLPNHKSAQQGRGLKTLLANDALQEPSSPAKPKPDLLPAWFFFAADLLLLAMSIAILVDAPRPLPPGDLLFCGVMVASGLLLGLAGIWKSARQP